MYPRPDGGNRTGEDRRRILVVDPDSRIAEALALALRQRAQVEWATSGMAGLMMAAEQEVDLAVIGADMPDMPSTGFLRTLRLLRPNLPIAIFRTRPHLEKPEVAEVDGQSSEPLDLKALLAWIADHLDQPAPRPPRLESPPVSWEIPREHLEIVRVVLDFIERHHREGIPLAVIARSAGLSRSHLCRIFKRVTGNSLKRFLTHHRLQAAKELLRESGLTIHQVARRIGYRDASHFDRVFRQWEGLTPSGYRRQAMLQAFRNGVPASGDPHHASRPSSSP